LENDSMPGLIKIGKTYKDCDERARILSNPSGVPTPFEVVFKLYSDTYEKLEIEIHRALAEYRVSLQREFFRFPVDGAVEVIKALHAGEPLSRIKVLKALHTGDLLTKKSLFENLKKELKDQHLHIRSDAASTLLSYIDKYQSSFDAVIQLLIYVVDSESWSDKSYVKHQAITWLRRTQDSRVKEVLRRYEQRIVSVQRSEEKTNSLVSWKRVRSRWVFIGCVFCVLSIGMFLLVQLAGC
jgi:HEAT repeat protein